MATGRGRLLQLHWRSLQAGRGAALRGIAGEAAGPRSCPGVRSPLAGAQKQPARPGQPQEKPPACSVTLESLPSELLLKIFSYLDAITLLGLGCVSRRLYHLSSDNLIWGRIYSAAFPPRRCQWGASSVQKAPVSSEKPPRVGDREAGYWKKEYVGRQIVSVRTSLAQLLKPINPYTGLPVKTKEALRLSGLGWVIRLKETCGKEHLLEHVDLVVNESSVTVVWHSKSWPRLATLDTLELCGVMPVFKGLSRNRPRWHSLIARYSLRVLKDCAPLGADRLVCVFCLQPGLLVGLWKRDEELAFIMAHLHVHELVERSTLGSASTPYEPPSHAPSLDDSPEHGLHGYQLHVDMHSSGVFYLCGTFRNLFTRKEHIADGYVKLVVVHFRNNTEHLPLVGNGGLSWKTDAFGGCIENCSVLDVTLLEETGRPFWCFSSPVCMRPVAVPPDGPSFLGRTYSVDYSDAEGQVRAQLVWIAETEEFFVISLELLLSTAKVNRWFGTRY
ncbi:F-box only protein 15 [Erinaceus europaeus]|uniref:F-box only protein 15 n=1 Tax=Erinaceus europaeus TaxID=9365 RepID=A0ABM3W0C5_ERIEU|nr:F-box only protein 15 [Erinaceus europaeus]